MSEELSSCSPDVLQKLYNEAVRQYEAAKARGLKLDMSRGRPAAAQLDICNGAMSTLKSYITPGGVDARNYGQLAGLDEIPAVILDGDDLKIAQVSIIENIQREDLNAVEEALAYQGLMDRFGLTQDQVSKQVGKSRSAIANLLRLLDLPEEVLVMLKNDEISAGHARALLGLNAEEDMINLAAKIVEKQLSVREVESAVKKLNTLPDLEEIVDSDAVNETVMTRIHLRELEKRTRETLGRKVKIVNNAKKRVVEIAFDSDEDLETLLSRVCGTEIFDNI